MPSETAEVPKLMTAEDVSEILREVPVSTIHAWARTGFLPSLKIGKHRRFRREDIERFIADRGAN